MLRFEVGSFPQTLCARWARGLVMGLPLNV